ncbi:hypothetical protein VH86_23270 [Pantoea sp. BL1]|nr:hypothetical protein VH86_23270 [Pantoea sp. BL1]
MESKLKFHYSLHRLSLIKQWQKDSFRIVFFILTGLFFSAVIKWLLPQLTHGNITGGFTGMLCGLAASFWFTNIAWLRIKSPIRLSDLNSVLAKYHYQQTEQGDYELQIAKYRRFKSQRIYIRNDGNEMTLEGPYNTLKRIINQLNK